VNRSERRSHGKKRRAPLALLLVPVILIGGAVVLVLVLTGNADVIDRVIPGGGGDKPVPEFEFKLSTIDVEATAEDADVEALRPGAEQVVQVVAPVLDTLFTEAFLNPNTWDDGEYPDALAEFSDAALASAQTGGLETLTLGPNAGDTYEAVAPNKGSIRFEVLFDREGEPFSVAAHVRFYADAKRQDGTYVAIVSHGVMFLMDQGEGWKVTAYDMKRNDHEEEAPATTGASGSSTSGPATTGGTGAS
jgi:hypothetical protein